MCASRACAGGAVPKVQFHQHALNAGELSPLLRGRVDVQKYQRGLKTATNVVSLVHGGVKRRPGTRFVREVKDSADITRLIPFVYDRSTAYILEFGDQYVRFYNSSGVVLSGSTPLEVATPYTSAQLSALTYAQNFDTMYLAHRSVAPRILRSVSASVWAIMGLPPRQTTPLTESDRLVMNAPYHAAIYPQTTLSLTGTTGTVTATTGVSHFVTGNVGQVITDLTNGATGYISAFTHAGSVTMVVMSGAFSSTSLTAGTWSMTGALNTTITPSSVPAGRTGRGTLVVLTGAGFSKSSSFPDSYASAPANHAGTVGLIYSINGGTAGVGIYTDSSNVSALIWTEIASATAPDASVYEMTPSWTAALGYPGAVGLSDQRVIWGSSASFPVTLWGSAIGDPGDYVIGSQDDDSWEFELAASEAHQVLHAVEIRDLIVLTAGSAWSLSAADGYTITPSNVKAQFQTPYGAAPVRPARVGNELVYVQRGGRKVRSIGYQYDIDSYQSPDLTLLSEHITEGGIVDMSYQQDPDYVVWCVRADGKLLAMTIERSQDVIAWTRCETDGSVESVATIPINATDRTYLVVNRSIGGTQRYVEYLDPALTLDCAVTGTAGSPTTVWSGLDHLEGETVGVIGDGVYQGTKVVSSGSVTIDTAATSVQIGLLPTVEIVTLTPEASPGLSGSQMMPIRANKIWLRVHESTGDVIVNGQTVTIAAPPTLYTGDVDISNIGWSDGDGSITIQQTQPYPLTILAIVQSVTVNQP